jgi:cytochrome P450
MIPDIPEELIPLTRFRTMRSASPIHVEGPNSPVHIYKYEDAKAVLSDHERFSSQFRSAPSEEEPIESTVLRVDPPRHRQLRSLVTRAFTPAAVEAMRPLIQSTAQELLDKAQSQGTIDAVSEWAAPLPVIVIAEMLGIPREDRKQFKAWSDELVGNDWERFMRCQREMAAYFAKIAEKRKQEPRNDLISRLVAVNADDGQLSAVELIGFCMLLLVAGNETTTNLISSALLCLDSLPDERERAAAEPERVPRMLEEVLRYCSPVQTVFRRVARDTELRGRRLTAGQHVHVWIGSANHDEDVFDQPHLFDASRDPNPHLSFGHGIHYCLGALLARLEADIAIRMWLERFPRFARDRTIRLERLDSGFVFGVKQLPIRLS